MVQYTKPYIKSILPYEEYVSPGLKGQLIFQDAATSSYFTLTNESSTGVRPPNHEQNGAVFTNFLAVLQYTKSSDYSSMKKLPNLMDDLLEHLEDVMNDEGISFIKCYKNQACWLSTTQPKSLKASVKNPLHQR
jgi:hypothetical protein